MIHKNAAILVVTITGRGKIFQMLPAKRKSYSNTVDERNPAMGYLPYQLVQDFFHQPYFVTNSTGELGYEPNTCDVKCYICLWTA